ncbi:MAG: hypothetical protein JHC31_09625 [Sulfurihydrogenibium sp.]|jgi:hypothetical protein|nr:hypothetical protein [Sulfurihydrogenibium sp.]
MIAAEHKEAKEINVSFKQICVACDCGNKIKKAILVINGYGFDDVKCSKCGKRHFVVAEDVEEE